MLVKLQGGPLDGETYYSPGPLELHRPRAVSPRGEVYTAKYLNLGLTAEHEDWQGKRTVPLLEFTGWIGEV